MKKRQPGKRYPLLVYRRIMGRLAMPTLVLGLVFLAAWGWSQYSLPPAFAKGAETWLLVGAGVSLLFGLFAFFSRGMTYVQPRRDHLRLVTPFLNLRISYRRVRSIHPASFVQLFPPQEAGWGERRLMEPFYGKTAVVVELMSFPLRPVFLRLFLPRQMFLRHFDGLVFVVADWIAFSTELDAFFGSWQQLQSHGRRSIDLWRR